MRVKQPTGLVLGQDTGLRGRQGLAVVPEQLSSQYPGSGFHGDQLDLMAVIVENQEGKRVGLGRGEEGNGGRDEGGDEDGKEDGDVDGNENGMKMMGMRMRTGVMRVELG